MNAVAEAPASPSAEHSEPAHHAATDGGHGGHGPKHKRGHGDHEGHGAGGHGGSWLVTYCDMITLLIAFFICILTFASAESGKYDHRKLRDSVIYGEGAGGVAGDDIKSQEKDAFVWRTVLIGANPANKGSPTPPMYSDPTMGVTKKALAMLEQPSKDVLADNYAMAIPMAILFSADGSLTGSGKQVLMSMANRLKTHPYDLLLHVDKQSQLRRLTTLSEFLENQGALAPSRVGIGLADAGGKSGDAVRFLFVKRPKVLAR